MLPHADAWHSLTQMRDIPLHRCVTFPYTDVWHSLTQMSDIPLHRCVTVTFPYTDMWRWHSLTQERDGDIPLHRRATMTFPYMDVTSPSVGWNFAVTNVVIALECLILVVSGTQVKILWKRLEAIGMEFNLTGLTNFTAVFHKNLESCLEVWVEDIQLSICALHHIHQTLKDRSHIYNSLIIYYWYYTNKILRNTI